VNRVLRLFRETNGLAPRAPGGGNYSPIRGRVEDALRALVAKTPDATVAELNAALCEQQGVSTSRSSVQRALLRIGLSRKKRAS
jgi:transposase